ncbi:MAG: hypothetical protein KDB27_25820 [Planctomycetales bacterium]|nr:hypothetical protein [Planctomycetales bacterium]
MLTPYGISLSESEVVIVVKKYPKKTSTNTEASAADQLDGVVLEVSQSMRRLLRLNRQLKNQHFRGQSLLRLERQREEMCQLAEGKLVFESTETWRAIYEDVLSACQCKRYLSVALVQTEDYWRGLPGDRSVSFNGLLVEYGFYVHRIFIIDDFLWPPKATLPSKHLYTWIVEQYGKGIQVGLLRLSDLDGDRELMRDFGIYGTTAAGYQTTDEIGQTVQFEMHFGPNHVRHAEDRWKRISLYSRPFETII